MTIQEFSSLFTILIATIGLLTLSWNMHQSNIQSRLSFFQNYTNRYHKIMINLPVEIKSDSYSLLSVDEKEREILVRWIRAFYDLCSEEYYLNQMGYVDKEVWRLWKAGMEITFSSTSFVDAWKIIQASKYYDVQFATFIENLQKGDIDADGQD